MPFAHPIVGHPHVDIPLALTASVTALLVFVVSLVVPARSQPVATTGQLLSSWAGSLSPVQVMTRVLAVVLLVAAIAAGRLGVDDQLDNLAPALVVGAGLPVLVLASVTVGSVWRYADPWDGVARMLSRGEGGDHPGHVWPAVAILLPVVWYLSIYPYALEPRSVGLALGLYTMATVAGCVAFGRVRWLASAEPIGVLLTWWSLLPRGRLADWEPPRGAEALLGVLAGGILFGAVRRTELWSGLVAIPGAVWYATAGLVVLCGLTAGFLVLMGRVADSIGGRPGVARGVVPAVAGIVVAVALERNVLFTSVQLLPGLLGDPFGQGWDLLGPALQGVNPAPMGAAALITLQLAILLLAHLVGAIFVARRLRDLARLPAATVLLHLMAGSVVAVALH